MPSVHLVRENLPGLGYFNVIGLDVMQEALEELGEITEEWGTELIRAFAKSLFVELLLHTPIRTGAARANWQAGVNAVPNTRIEREALIYHKTEEFLGDTFQSPQLHAPFKRSRIGKQSSFYEYHPLAAFGDDGPGPSKANLSPPFGASRAQESFRPALRWKDRAIEHIRVLDKAIKGDSVHIVNNLTYIQYLDGGSSPQAAQGIVGPSMAKLRTQFGQFIEVAGSAVNSKRGRGRKFIQMKQFATKMDWIERINGAYDPGYEIKTRYTPPTVYARAQEAFYSNKLANIRRRAREGPGSLARQEEDIFRDAIAEFPIRQARKKASADRVAAERDLIKRIKSVEASLRKKKSTRGPIKKRRVRKR